MQQKLDRDEELKKWRWRYEQRAKPGKGRLLEEFCQQYCFSRKLLSNCWPWLAGAADHSACWPPAQV
jgi:hypothetical protein